ncbi:MAG TPA: NADPH-dependent glutamate synthase [Spirochaetota bacterium]|nr:NADPH-dependent glutamate synthase [Spirochaetota bacterium]HQH98380.1 NADPH-dependent glutamate synthase [Spirochaetota bacterium]
MENTKLTNKERLAIPPQKMPEQEPSERIHNVNEVPLGFTEEMAVAEAERCLQCKNAPCVKGCPVEVNIPVFIQFIAERKFREAVDAIKVTNVLPAVCGRVCPQEEQCQKPCTVGKSLKSVDRAVQIGKLERFVADWEMAQNTAVTPEIKTETGKKIAIIGCGPAGITVAADCRREGHTVTIFEALHKPGGVLAYGIPEFRLPKKIVGREVDNLVRMGVELRANMVIGKIYTIDELMENGYDAVFVGTGAGLPVFLNIPGENLNGVYSANEYLTRANLMQAYSFPNTATPIARSKNVAVFGGGNVAMDAARTALRLGAKNVYLVYRRSRDEMPARKEEIHHAEEEGVQMNYLQNPVRFIGDDKGWVSGVECLLMELGEPDDSGRRRPVPVKGSEFVIPVDTCIVAIGNASNPLIPHTSPDIKVTRWGNIIADEETLKTSKKGVFAGGDIVLGAATVILAMGQGRRAARAINEYLATGQW